MRGTWSSSPSARARSRPGAQARPTRSSAPRSISRAMPRATPPAPCSPSTAVRSGAWRAPAIYPDLKSGQATARLLPMGAKPLWLRAVHRVERAVGEPVEAAVRTETYFDVMTTATRTTPAAKRKVAEVSTRALHLLNLPAGTDVQRMREQLARMERRLNQLSEQVEERD